MSDDRPAKSTATQDHPEGADAVPANGDAPGETSAAAPLPPPDEVATPGVPAEEPPEDAGVPTDTRPPDEPPAPEEPPTPEPAAQAAPKAPPAPAPRPKRPPRPRDPLPWPELRAAATAVSEGADVEALKELFRLLPEDIREETVTAVREYRKGARRPVSAFAGKSLARAVHTSRRARRRPDSDEAVSEAIGQALAAEVIASLEVEIAAEVILPKRDLLERESRNARRRQKADDDRARDEKRRKAREESGAKGATFGTYSGAKIRGLDELAKLFEEQQPEKG